MQVTFQRHFESAANSRGPITDSMSLEQRLGIQHLGGLTMPGIQQALAERLTNKEPDLLFSSAMQRAIQSAQLSYPDTEIVIDARLSERCYGELTMLSKAFMARNYTAQLQAKASEPFTWQPPQGESFIEMRERLSGFLTELSGLEADRVVCITHETAILGIRTLFQDPAMDSIVEYAQANPMPFGYKYQVEL